jgi:hypothetical protein
MIQNPYYIAETTSNMCSVEFIFSEVPNYYILKSLEAIR